MAGFLTHCQDEESRQDSRKAQNRPSETPCWACSISVCRISLLRLLGSLLLPREELDFGAPPLEKIMC